MSRRPAAVDDTSAEFRAFLADAIAAASRGQDVWDLFPEPKKLVVDYNDKNHWYWVNGEHVPSVTTVLDTIPKPAIPWWAFRVGMAGVLRLLAEDKLSLGALLSWDWENVIKPDPAHPDTVLTGKELKPKSPLEVEAMKIRHHPNAIKEDRGTVGTSVHQGAEQLAITGSVPEIESYPPEDRGFIQGLARWYVANEPEFEHLEVIRGSARFKFAGRFDLIARVKGLGRIMCDYKTSRGIYEDHQVQLGAYDLAWRATGGEPLDGHFIVHLRPDGTYEMRPVEISHVDFLVERLALEQRKDAAARFKAAGLSTTTELKEAA